MKTAIVNTNFHTVAINADFSPMDMICDLLEQHFMDDASDELIKKLGAYVTRMNQVNPGMAARLERTNPLFLAMMSGLNYRGEVGNDCPFND